MKCVICGIRKPKRRCPGVHGDICTVCCGTEREQTVLCPLGCEYLHEAHLHERIPEVNLSKVPNGEFSLSEKFLKKYEETLSILGAAVFEAAMKSQAATDYDAREALEALIVSCKAAETGLIYESKPVNPYAAAIFDLIHKRIQGLGDLRDQAILSVLIFLQRLEYRTNNGRRRSRAFLGHLRKIYSLRLELEALANSPEPEAPLVIL